jgi:hypothetical protein
MMTYCPAWRYIPMDVIYIPSGLVPDPVQDKSATAVVDGVDQATRDPNWAV